MFVRCDQRIVAAWSCGVEAPSAVSGHRIDTIAQPTGALAEPVLAPSSPPVLCLEFVS
jgi:hypothetical protein